MEGGGDPTDPGAGGDHAEPRSLETPQGQPACPQETLREGSGPAGPWVLALAPCLQESLVPSATWVGPGAPGVAAVASVGGWRDGGGANGAGHAGPSLPDLST